MSEAIVTLKKGEGRTIKDFSWIKNTIVSASRGFARTRECLTALLTWEPLILNLLSKYFDAFYNYRHEND